MKLARIPRPQRPYRRPPAADEIVPLANFKSVIWPLSDALAAEAAPGRIIKLQLVVRFEDIAQYKNGRLTWMTSVLEVGRTHD